MRCYLLREGREKAFLCGRSLHIFEREGERDTCYSRCYQRMNQVHPQYIEHPYVHIYYIASAHRIYADCSAAVTRTPAASSICAAFCAFPTKRPRFELRCKKKKIYSRVEWHAQQINCLDFAPAERRTIDLLARGQPLFFLDSPSFFIVVEERAEAIRRI